MTTGWVVYARTVQTAAWARPVQSRIARLSKRSATLPASGPSSASGSTDAIITAATPYPLSPLDCSVSASAVAARKSPQ
jgi:hypothetical protein